MVISPFLFIGLSGGIGYLQGSSMAKNDKVAVVTTVPSVAEGLKNVNGVNFDYKDEASAKEAIKDEKLKGYLTIDQEDKGQIGFVYAFLDPPYSFMCGKTIFDKGKFFLDFCQTLFTDISQMGGDAEKVFIFLIHKLFNPWMAGILFAAILSAIMSTISSQLLVSSNTLTEDFYKHIVKREKTHKEMIWVGRLCVIVIFVIASVLAMNPSSKVLELVSYAWAGFGGVFSPVILFTLYKKDLHWKTVLVSMIIATITVITWKTSGLSNILYEMVPAFVINSISIYLLEKFKVFGNNEK